MSLFAICHNKQLNNVVPTKSHLFQQSHIGYPTFGVTIEHYIKINLNSSRLTYEFDSSLPYLYFKQSSLCDDDPLYMRSEHHIKVNLDLFKSNLAHFTSSKAFFVTLTTQICMLNLLEGLWTSIHLCTK
jgi:hypothetical protein